VEDLWGVEDDGSSGGRGRKQRSRGLGREGKIRLGGGDWLKQNDGKRVSSVKFLRNEREKVVNKGYQKRLKTKNLF